MILIALGSNLKSEAYGDPLKNCYKAMDDDFNSPLLIAQLFEAVKFINLVINKHQPIENSQLKVLNDMLPVFIYDVLGIDVVKKSSSRTEEKLNQTINLLIELREKARNNKEFETSDKIRDQLEKYGIYLNDGKDITKFTFD